MRISKISQKVMLQGVRTGSDLKKIVFSPKGDYAISISRTMLVKLWNVKTQTLIKDFKELIAHEGTFTLDSKGFILTGPEKIHYVNLETNEEIFQFSNGYNLGAGQFSPDNLYYAYSNNSNLYVRQLNNFSNFQNTENSKCLPSKPIFHYPTNTLYTSSQSTGIICKWDIQTLQVKAMGNFNTIISDLDFTDRYLIVSTNKNKRQVLFLNPDTLEIVSTKTIPRVNFLDVNTEIHSTYSQEYTLILSVAIPGDYLFMFNATNLQSLPPIKFPINTYTVAYEPFNMILGIGGQVANKETNRIQDQVLLYQIQRNCSGFANTVTSGKLQAICKCVSRYFWKSEIQSCLPMTCQVDEQQTGCVCDENKRWSKLSQECEWWCGSIEGSFQSETYGVDKKCPCVVGYEWQDGKCRKLIDCKNIEFGKSNKDKYTCDCQNKFMYDSESSSCRINCLQIPKAQNTTDGRSCSCVDNYEWVKQTYQCRQIIHQKSPLLNISSLIIIVASVGALILLIVAGVCLFKHFRKQNDQIQHVPSTNSNLRPQSVRIGLSDSNGISNPSLHQDPIANQPNYNIRSSGSSAPESLESK